MEKDFAIGLILTRDDYKYLNERDKLSLAWDVAIKNGSSVAIKKMIYARFEPETANILSGQIDKAYDLWKQQNA